MSTTLSYTRNKNIAEIMKLLFLLSLLISPLWGKAPNIIYILADDLGYGDVQCLNPERGKIPTPHMDQLARDGMTFTDAHTTSSVCTPTRYSIITGRYNWRTKLQKSVIYGYDTPLIPTSRMTVPSFLQENGYQTAMIGKWHLGLTLPTTDGKPAKPKGNLKEKLNKGAYPPSEISNIAWDQEILGGPVDLGFDTLYGISASLDMPPYVWIKDRHFMADGSHVKAFHRPGPASADFKAVDVLDKLTAGVVQYVNDYEGEKPFFIYMPIPSPHTPIVPTAKWKGKSGINQYADFVMQTDDVVGQVVAALEKNGLTENTLLIVTSDNGCSPQANLKTLEKHGHYPSAQFRGFKSDIWEGGHRVPYFVKWPKVIKAGSLSHTTTCQTSLLATCADILGKTIPKNAGEDSESELAIYQGEAPDFSRKGIIHHSINGYFAYREGKWKLILGAGSTGWAKPNTNEALKQGAPKAQLYDLEADPGEQHNLYLKHPEIATKLLTNLTEYVENGASAPGKDSTNDVPVTLWK